MQRHPSSRPTISSPIEAWFLEAAATSALLRFGSVLALGIAMTSCVPAKSYQEARSAAENEFSAHGKTRSRLEAAHERIRTLEQAIGDRDRALETGASSFAAAKLENIVVGKDKEAALELVAQLRSELARTGSHLSAFSDEKKNLSQALVLAEERVRSIEAAEKRLGELIATASDLSLAVGTDARESGIVLGARDGQIVLAVPRKLLFSDGSDDLIVDAAPVLSAVGKVTSEHGSVRVVLRAPEKASLAEARITRLHAALRDRGVPEARLVLPSRAVREEESPSGDFATSSSIAPVATDPAAPNGATDARAVAPAPDSSVPAAPPDDPSASYEICFAI